MSNDATYAAAPFDHAKADIISRSSDTVYFRVFKLFLSLASPFFETLFDIPQPVEENDDQEVKDGLVVVPVTEDRKTLGALLRFCYPCTMTEDPTLEVLQDALSVLEAAKKYSLNVIETKARRAIAGPKFLEANALRCFAIAHRGRLREESRLAARYTLARPLIPSWFQELELITATDFLSLLTYHKRCEDAVYALRLNLSWVMAHYGSEQACAWLAGIHYDQRGNSGSNCGCPKSDSPKYSVFQSRNVSVFGTSKLPAAIPLQWWDDFMEGTFLGLRDKPCKETAQACADKTVQEVKARNCQACSPKVTEGMRDFLKLLTRKIDETVAQVKLFATRESLESDARLARLS